VTTIETRADQQPTTDTAGNTIKDAFGNPVVEEAAARPLPAARTRARLAGDRVMVAVGPDQQAEQLVRAGKRLADALDSDWIVVYVETPELLRLSDAQRNRRTDVQRLAESLGAAQVTLEGTTAAAALLEYAQTRNATRVIVGAPKRRGWRAWLRPSTSTQLVHHARGFDVTVIAPEEHVQSRGAEGSRATLVETRPKIRWDLYGWALVTTLVCTVVAFTLYPYIELANLVMVYLLGVTVAGLKFGRGPSVMTSVLNAVMFDFFFVPPRFSFAISDVQYLVTLVVLLIVALVIANLTASVRQQTKVVGARELRTALLYAMSRELAATRDILGMSRVAVRHVAESFQCQAVILLPDPAGKLGYPRDPPLDRSFRSADLHVAQWVADHGHQAGRGTDTLSAAPGLYIPLGDDKQRLGVLAVLPTDPERALLPEQRHLIGTFAGQIGLALERARLAEAAEAANLMAEGESLRNMLLASISHDLRTPLAVIAGAGSTLADTRGVDDATRLVLARSIEAKARGMSELVTNVLDLVRFESGQVVLRRDWQTVEDLVGTALRTLEAKLEDHLIEVRIPPEFPLVYVDATLVLQVFDNLLDNVSKYTPGGTHVCVSAVAGGQFAHVLVEDDGPGLPPGDPARLFDKFQRGNSEGNVMGVGLGLAICRAVVHAHGGQIQAKRRARGGASFEFTVPIAEIAP
jgi:two-component system, OmpR family, sensor histidine kinase KdpD